MKSLGIYIHIPFCKSKCRYCDFCSFPHPRPETVKKYISELISEIEEYGKTYGEYTVNTVYFGGGTPTLLDAEDLAKILCSVKKSYRVDPNAEITTECNPATGGFEYFKKLCDAGFNRLSIGVQSMNERELKLLGRLHSADDAKKTFFEARNAGFENISVDVMFGIPEQTPNSLSETLDELCSLSPEHVSLYGLKIEDGTHFARHADSLVLPDEDTEYEMYLSSVKKLSEFGLKRYEISNFAKDGYASRHNLKYWQREDYLGVGLAAHSCIGSRRFLNVANMEKYFSGERIAGEETITPHDILCEKIMLGMRLDVGVDFELLQKSTDEDVQKYERAFDRYILGGYAKKEGRRLSFSNDGMYVSNSILSEILDFEK